MKRFAAVLLMLCLLLTMPTGCKASNRTEQENIAATEASSIPESTVSVTELDPEDVEATVPKDGLLTGEGENALSIGKTGKCRLTYSGNISSVRYVTSAEALPEVPELGGYDTDYFREHGLLLITETVSSGSVDVGVEAIRLNETVAEIMLFHESRGDMGTTVMTTWLIWVEVEAGLADYTWVIQNPALPPETERS